MNLAYYAIIAGLTLVAGAIAHAESDLSREIREAQSKSQRRERRDEAQLEAGRRLGVKKAAVATLAAKGLKISAAESAGSQDGYDLVNIKLADGRVCQSSATDEIISQEEESDSSSILASRVQRVKARLAIARKLSDAGQTRRALARIADLAELDEFSSELSVAQRRLDAFLVEADIRLIRSYVKCYDASGRAREIAGDHLANRNGAIADADL